eukprot:5712175-Pyramimonas_sp.AAC.1
MQDVVDGLVARSDRIGEGAQTFGRELGVSGERAHVSGHGLQVPGPLSEEQAALAANFSYPCLTSSPAQRNMRDPSR